MPRKTKPKFRIYTATDMVVDVLYRGALQYADKYHGVRQEASARLFALAEAFDKEELERLKQERAAWQEGAARALQAMGAGSRARPSKRKRA